MRASPHPAMIPGHEAFSFQPGYGKEKTADDMDET